MSWRWLPAGPRIAALPPRLVGYLSYDLLGLFALHATQGRADREGAMEAHLNRSLPPLPTAEESPADRVGPEFWLYFNAQGEIDYCSPLLAQLLGRGLAEIKGISITSLLPALPVNGKTPGYNVAALTMDYVNRSHSLELQLPGEGSLPVEALISSTYLGSRPVFIVELCRPGGTRLAPG
jgi:hypothetical protein